MTYRIEFTLPGLPKPTNRQESMHWRQKRKQTKLWHQAVALVVGYRKPPKPLTKAKLTLTRMSSVCPDYDGLVSSFKPITDGLVVCGVLEDDNMDVIGVPEFKWVRSRPKQGLIAIIVEKI